jgi:hypothetical protein
MLIAGGMLLVLFGVMNEINNAPHTPNALMKVGALILLFSWNILSIWALLSWFRIPQNIEENPVYGAGTTVSSPPSTFLQRYVLTRYSCYLAFCVASLSLG